MDMKKVVFVVFILLLMSIAVVFESVSPVVAQETIYIRADGRVDPATAPIYRDGNLYTFTDNIFDKLVVERDNIVVNGASHTLQGTGSGRGINLDRRSNVSIQNMYIREFDYGIYLRDSSNINIYGNTITNNEDGIYLYNSFGNSIYENQITNNEDGIYLRSSPDNLFYHNNFIGNTWQVYVRSTRLNVWDNGEEGNYWSDYLGWDSDGDGIGDIPYVIDYSNNIDYYPLMDPWIPPPDTTPPVVSIISPENKTYSVTAVDLTFVVSETTSWIGYSLDNQANETIDGKITIDGLSDGTHTIIVYANDTSGNMGSSDTIYFTIDTVAPDIEIVSPENKTYSTDFISLIFTLNEPTSWMGYSLDDQANLTITENSTLTNLSEGMHSLVVYASDIIGNQGSSNKVYFTVDTSPPNIIILSPENKTYDTTNVPLTFTVDETVSWMAYSIDGQTNVPIAGNTTLSPPDGTHYVVVYVSDNAGNIGASNRVYFTVDSAAPSISLVSPTNTSYASTSVPLEFVVDEPTFWIGYSLDNQDNVTVKGNITLTDLSEGEHTITVYANDTAGNMGSSETVNFTVDTAPPTITILSPDNRIYDTTSVPLTFTMSEATPWIGYSLDNQNNVTITGNTTLTGLSEGAHTIEMWANDTAGNMGSSGTVSFTIRVTPVGPTPTPIDRTPPTISIESPQNITYTTTSVPLTFTVSEKTSWISYGLDGQATVTITGNTDLTGLSDGTHSLVVYAKDMAGNSGSSPRVYFTIDTTLPDTTSPSVFILSPENKTYDTPDTPLTFTIDETVSWMAYSIDDQANVTITEDITLYGLTNGTHSLTLYARDTAGNTGASEKIYFTIEPKKAGPTQLWVVAVITIIAGAGFAFTGYLAYDLFKKTTRPEPRHRSKETS